MSMTSKQRMLVALDGGVPDRLPVTTHFLLPHLLNMCMGGMSEDEFFDACGWDPILYTVPHRPDQTRGEYYDPDQGEPGFLESRRIAAKICMIGGFDQFHFFKGCTADQTRAEVRRCFEAAGRNGAYILCPSDNFFEAEPELVKAFADEAKKCVYEDAHHATRVD